MGNGNTPNNAPDIGTALSQILQQSGGALPTIQSPQPIAPQMESQSPMTPQASPMAALLSQAMQRLNSTPFQPTPTGGGPIDASVHPVIAKVIQALAGGAQNFGWAAMPPQERLERTQLEQNKAETMARLAQAGVAQEQTAAWRQSEAETARERAASYEENVQRQKDRDKTMADIAKSRIDVQQEMVGVRKALGEGRLEVAHAQLTQRAQQFEQMFKLRAQQVGIEQAKLDLMEQGNMIKQGFLDVARGALSQRGTVEGAQVVEKLQTLQLEHPFLSQMFGLSDVADAVSQSRGAQIPGVAPTGTPTAPAATAPLPAPGAPNKPRNAPKSNNVPAGSVVLDPQGRPHRSDGTHPLPKGWSLQGQ